MDDFADADVGDRYDPDAVEDRIFEYWETVDAYERTVAHHAEDPPYFFVDGPPYTSGSAHMGHAWNKSLKDVYIRYKRMRGYDVYDRPGYDMHGLPIETRVEEDLAFESKKDIEAYGVEAFIDACREFAEESLQGLQSDFQSFGVWMDWENPYRTLDPEYMESAWWAFQRADERGLVEQGLRSITQCPRCETAIANNEVEYHEVEDPSVYVQFPLEQREGSLVAWTTTPWTIPANTFVAVDEELTYRAVRAGHGDDTELLYVAAPCVEDVLSEAGYEDYEVVAEYEGAEMVGWRYEPPLPAVEHPGGEDAFRVYAADYVEADRTGLVHSAPGHGEEDFERGTELELPVFCPVGPDGVFDERAGPYADSFVRDANDDIIADLEERGLLLSSGRYVHDYGQCWRCDTDIVQLVTDQWFITVTDVKEELLANIEDSEWFPGEARDERFRNFVADSPDWNVSRQRYWGIPIPIWLPPDWDGDMDEAVVVGTREELAERADQELDPDEMDLHKPTVDGVTITEDGVTHERVPDVFDVWLDSSVATWGTLGYPGAEESETAFEELWPADLIIEAHDQTRGWFWSQLGMGTTALETTPYEQVVMHGHALMPDGRAMSKSRDITIRPSEVLTEHGADPMRLFLLSIAARGDDMRISWEELEEMQRRLNILWNAFRFPLPYMETDGFDPAGADPAAADLRTVDRWLLSRLQTVEREATAAMEEFAQDEALEAVLDFVVEDLSRYYIQVVRERMWEEADTASKEAAYATIAAVLRETTALLAPFAPFVTEEIYQRLTGDSGHPTVHMRDWPEAEDSLVEERLEEDIEIIRSIEQAGSAARQQADRGLRWPVRRVIVSAPNERVVEAVSSHRPLLEQRLNTRDIELVGPDGEWDELTFAGEADMSELGPAFGDDAGRIMEALNEASVDEPSIEALEKAVEEGTGLNVTLDESMVLPVHRLPDDVYDMGFTIDSEDKEYDEQAGEVFVDATLTEAIESEGYAREVIRRVQEMRKDLDLEMDAEIRLAIDVAEGRVAEFVADHEALIREEVRARELGDVEEPALVETWDIEGVTVDIAVAPVAGATP